MRWALPAITLSTLLLLAPVLAADSHTVSATLTGNDLAGCGVDPDVIYCLEVTEGSLDGLTTGEEVVLTLVNEGQFSHNVYVADADEADQGGDTSDGAAFANSETIGAGEETTFNFTIPEGISELYLWCELGNHESGGMWLTVDVQAGPGELTDGTDGGQGEEAESASSDDAGTGNEFPSGWFLGAFAVVAIALFAADVVRS